MEANSIKTIIKQICAEKGISEESVVETINSALAAAYRKDFGEKNQNVQAEFNLVTGGTAIFDVKEVVEDLSPEELAALEALKAEREAIKEALAKGEITTEELKQQREEKHLAEVEEEPIEGAEDERHFNPRTEIQLSEAKAIDEKYNIGDFVKTELEIPGSFGRMAAQTAKQVIIQRLKEAERNVIYQEFKEREGEIMTGMVQKIEGRNVIVELDKTSAILPPNEQIYRERYHIGDKIKVYLLSVALSTRGSELIVSRTHPDIVRRLFVLEIPEIANGIIQIKEIAREAGSRTKIAVSTDDASIDPIGSCIGQRGARIQTIINELAGEKIDIIEYSEDPVKYINNALLPAKIERVTINEKDKSAVVIVPKDQLSLTIGRAGQNVRLASKLTGWRINIKDQESGQEIAPEDVVDGEVKIAEAVPEEKPAKVKKEKKPKKEKKAKEEAEKIEKEGEILKQVFDAAQTDIVQDDDIKEKKPTKTKKEKVKKSDK